MYCHLCHIEVSPSHDGSSGHHAARQLAAVAVDRLAKHLEASGDSVAGTNILLEADKVKTPEAVSYCDCCNAVVPINEHSAHIRLKNHALALLNEQMFEELVLAYMDERDPKMVSSSELTDDGAFVDETEAANTYTCHLCSLQVPQVFKAEHERGTRHLASRTLALAAARRASASLSRFDGPMEKSDCKFTGKMMKKLLKAYTWNIEERVKEEKEIEEKVDGDEETEPTQHTQKRLTAKKYFTDILPYLPYVGAFHTVIVDDTEFITIQINNETLKIHVNNFNGLYNLEGKYMNCRLCNGFSGVCYSSVGQEDEQHVMSLGHIRNVFSPFDNVHLIRKIDNSHSLCGLCNVHFTSHYVDEHIFKDTRHTTALIEALQKGKEYKENKENLKIMIYTPPPQKQSGFMKPNQFNRWNFGIQQPRSGTLFGSTQNTGFGSTNTGFGNTQNTGFGSTNTGFGNTQNTGFGTTQDTGFGSTKTGFGNTQNTGFGSSQNTGFGGAQSTFGSTQAATFGTQNNFGAQTTTFGANQKSFGGNQNSFGGAQSGFGGAQSQQPDKNSSLGAIFGGVQNTPFGGIQPQSQTNVINSASSNQSTPAFSNSQSIFGGLKSGLLGNAQNTTTFVSVQAGAPQQSNSVSVNGQINAARLGNSQAAQTNSSQQGNSTGFGNTQKTPLSFVNAQPTGMKFIFPQNNTVGDATGQNNKSSNIPTVTTTAALQDCTVGLQQKNKAPTDFVFFKKPSTENTTSPSQGHSVDLKNNDFAQSPNQTKLLGANEKSDFGDAQAKSEIVGVTDGTQSSTLIRPQRKLNYSSSSDSDSD